MTATVVIAVCVLIVHVNRAFVCMCVRACKHICACVHAYVRACYHVLVLSSVSISYV